MSGEWIAYLCSFGFALAGAAAVDGSSLGVGVLLGVAALVSFGIGRLLREEP